MKYDKRPCNTTDCNRWIDEPEICKRCMDTLFAFVPNPSWIENIFYNIKYYITGEFLFAFAIWYLQRWLKKNDIEDTVFIIGTDVWSFDDYNKHKDLI